ncbi:hypothetical protein QFC21_000599 [Naganishia friedmannii]|uniref:Uncharacterized protein n=1 Tax=Naganishia friedmannii TaxID=89922 RepID=A0ACC2WBZ4_9TREE|nr:hypothetical protein QFC21_000599 [Naganishia friedmannii]
MKRSLRSNPASVNQGAYVDTGHSDHLAFNRAINTNHNRGYPVSGDEGDDHSDYPSPPRHFPGGGHQLPDIPTSSHQRYNNGRDSEDGRNGADLELPLYTKMSATGVQIGGEARRRAGGGGAGLHSVMSEDMSGHINPHYQTSYGESLAAGNESEKHPLYDNTYAEDDDTGKAWGSKGYGAGPGRGGRRGLPPVTIRNPKNWKEWIVYHEEWVWTGVYTLLAMLTRYWKIGWADYVVWDEAHFGKFGSHYINRDFYFDVHPPLGKMLVGLAGLLSGYNGGFEFKSGEHYPETVPYTAIRVILATFGVGMVPVAWWTAGELGWSRQARHFVTLCVLCVEDLWDKFGDLKMPKMTYLKHWLARGLCLILIPFCVYAMSFKLHFLILNRSGPGDAQMSSLFQAHLKGNDFAESPLEIAIGSKITVKNYGYGGGLLHSHVQTFPVGSNQQQVTCYHYKDDNNNFVVAPTWDEPAYDPEAPLKFLQDGSIIRLVHASTGRNLHSHAVAAPMTKNHFEVAGYGNASVGDSNDHWIVEVVDDMHKGNKEHVERIHALTTRMRFKHATLNCYLRAANVPLPQWGFKQIEVTCDKENNPKDVHTYWNIESHWNDRLPKGNAQLYKSPFWKDFWHLNVAMMTSNNALVPDPDKEDILASAPLDWPLLHLGLRMCGWGDNQIKYYLIGTPIIWWGSTISLFVGLFTLGFYLMRMQRQYQDWAPGEWDNWLYVLKIAFSGWAFHYRK